MFCSGESLLTDAVTRDCSEAGTGDATTIFITVPAGTEGIAMVWISDPIGVGNWPAGDYTVRWNQVFNSTSVDWNGIDICRVNSSCVNQESLYTESNIKEALSAGVHALTFTASAAPSAVSTDRLAFIITLNNTDMMNDFDVTVRSGQLMNTPIVAASGRTPGFLAVQRRDTNLSAIRRM